MSDVKVKIYDGNHYDNPILIEYDEKGDVDAIIDEARDICQKVAPGKLVWVDFVDNVEGFIITHRNYQEGFVD